MVKKPDTIVLILREKMNTVDYDINLGYCGRCRPIVEWKQILGEMKDYE